MTILRNVHIIDGDAAVGDPVDIDFGDTITSIYPAEGGQGRPRRGTSCPVSSTPMCT